ncbi:MAG TPA: hypothetical protein VGP73_24395 [Thermoanaerobaculia bacterium]
MKKHQRGGREPIEEIVSLNDELFSLVTGDPLAALDERLAMVAAADGTCVSYTCSGFSGCGSFSCGTFKII